MNTLDNKITITIIQQEDGFVIHDDTESFIDFVHIEDANLLENIVSSIVKDRINGNESSSLW